MRTGRIAGLLASCALVAAVATTPPAHAEGEIGLSTDGVTWASSITLADPVAGPIVPGGSDVRAFSVRNQGPSAGVLSVDVDATDPDGLLASADLTLEARVDDGPWVPVAVGTTAIARGVVVEQLDAARVEVRAALAPLAGPQTQDSAAPFDVRLTLSEADAVGGAEEGASSDGSDGSVGAENDASGLPGTGADVSPALVWGAAGLLGAGIALVRRSRRPVDGAGS